MFITFFVFTVHSLRKQSSCAAICSFWSDVLLFFGGFSLDPKCTQLFQKIIYNEATVLQLSIFYFIDPRFFFIFLTKRTLLCFKKEKESHGR